MISDRLRPGLAAAVLVFAAPNLLRALGFPASYGVVTLVLVLAVLSIVAAARDAGGRRLPAVSAGAGLATATGISAAVLIGVAAYRWIVLSSWYPYNADMLIVIREATRRVLSGRLPYTTYRSYDAPWNMAMPYGPILWAPFLAAQLLRLDFRLLTIAGELFVPAWCGIAATIAASRGRIVEAAGCLALLASLLIALDLQRYTLIGHTPIYWPLFLLLALAIARRRWVAAAAVLGLLVAARTTMVAIVPVFAMAAFAAKRRSSLVPLATLFLVIAAALGPFLIWNWHAVWDSMVLSYPRVMKIAVWPDLAKPGLTTIGITEWLLERHHESLVVPVQLGAMIVVYTASWIAIRRGRPSLPWMALALFAFSLTSLYPVHYLYYDVLLLLVCWVLTQTVDPAVAPRLVVPWALSLTAVLVLPFTMLRATVSPWPHLVAGQNSGYTEFRSGFAAVEHENGRPFSWIVGTEGRVVLPRSSASDAEVVLTAESPFGGNEPPQRMAAILNGTTLGETTVPAGPCQIRLRAPRSTWWIGFNELRLVFSSTFVPREAGSSEDSRPLALSVRAIDVVAPR